MSRVPAPFVSPGCHRGSRPRDGGGGGGSALKPGAGSVGTPAAPRPAGALTLSLRLPGAKAGQENVEDAEQEVHGRGRAAVAAVLREAQPRHAEPRRAELRLGRGGRRRGRLRGHRAPPPPAARLRPPRPAPPRTWPGSSAAAPAGARAKSPAKQE